MKPTRTSADEAASPRGLKRFNRGTLAVIASKMALRKRGIEAMQTSTDRRIILKKLHMGSKVVYILKAGIINGDTDKEIVAKQLNRIL